MAPRSRKGVEELYFEWLYNKIGLRRGLNPEKSYWLLAEQLHRKEFQWFVPNDDNRVADGLDLREEFSQDVQTWGDSVYIFEDVSTLEVLIALAKRIDFELEGSSVDDTGVGVWFWRMLEHVGLDTYTDQYYMDNECADEIDHILDNIIHRRYYHNGQGGLFPLKNPQHDQRGVELWYQMSAWLLENGDFV